jgi:hypothetical protein
MVSVAVAVMALLAAQQQTVPDRFRRAISELKYKTTLPMGSPFQYGQIEVSKRSYRIELIETTTPDRSTWRLHLAFRFRPAKPVSLRFIQGWLAEVHTGSVKDLFASGGLDGTVLIRMRFDVDEFLTAKSIQEQILTFDSYAAGAVEEMPLSGPTTAEFILDENQRIDALDDYDMRFLIKHWGWAYKGGFGGSSPTWMVPSTIKGLMVVIAPAHPGKLIRNQLFVGASFEARAGIDAESHAKTIRAKLKGWEVSVFSETRLGVSLTIDMAGGISLRTVKNRLEDFANKVSPFAKSADNR